MKQLEEYLQKASNVQKILFYITPLVLIGMLMFSFIVPTLDEKTQELKDKKYNLEKKLTRARPRTTRLKISKAKKELIKTKDSIEADKDDLNFLYARLSNLEFIQISKEKWTLTLDALLKKSISLNIDIKYIKDLDSKLEQKVSDNIIPKKYVEISGSGDYKSILQYLHFIENRDFIMNIKNLKIEKNLKKVDDLDKHKDSLTFAINFTIYGVNI